MDAAQFLMLPIYYACRVTLALTECCVVECDHLSFVKANIMHGGNTGGSKVVATRALRESLRRLLVKCGWLHLTVHVILISLLTGVSVVR